MTPTPTTCPAPAGTDARSALRHPAGLSAAALMLAMPIMAAAPAQAEDAEPGVIEAEAKEIVARMAAHLKSARSFSFVSEGFYEVVSPSGIKLLVGRTAEVAVKRPDHLFIRAMRDDGTRTRIWFDGTTLSVLQRGSEGLRYATMEAPEDARSIDGIMDYMIREHDYVLHVGDLLYEDLGSTVSEGMLSAIALGPSLVDGRPCHHVSLEFPGVDAQIWVQDGDEPSPCRWAFNLDEVEGSPLYVSDINGWVSNPEIGPARFAFETPAGAEEADIADLLGGNAMFE